jgi:hypothetical protein
VRYPDPTRGREGEPLAPAAIENRVINSPFVEPTRHFVLKDGRPTGEIEERRRPSEFFVPVAPPQRSSGAQLALDQFGPPTTAR